MRDASNTITVRVGREVQIGLNHTLEIDRMRMGARYTWFYIKENKNGIRISHVRYLDNDIVMVFGADVTLQGKSLESLLSYFPNRPGSAGT